VHEEQAALPESLYRYLMPGGAPRERTAAYALRGSCPAITILERPGDTGTRSTFLPKAKIMSGDCINVEKLVVSPTLRTEAHGNLPVITIQKPVEVIPMNMQIATQHKALGKGTGFGIGEDGNPAYTLQEGHCHVIAVGVHQNQEGQVSIVS